MIRLGFTVIPPEMPPFTVIYNGHPVNRCQSREDAEEFIGKLNNPIGYNIREERT